MFRHLYYSKFAERKTTPPAENSPPLPLLLLGVFPGGGGASAGDFALKVFLERKVCNPRRRFVPMPGRIIPQSRLWRASFLSQGSLSLSESSSRTQKRTSLVRTFSFTKPSRGLLAFPLWEKWVRETASAGSAQKKNPGVENPGFFHSVMFRKKGLT